MYITTRPLRCSEGGDSEEVRQGSLTAHNAFQKIMVLAVEGWPLPFLPPSLIFRFPFRSPPSPLRLHRSLAGQSSTELALLILSLYLKES
jgi:hypothetical protein